MKKAVAVFLVLLFVLAVTGPGYCQDAGRKLGRGIANVVTCPFEIPVTMINTYCKDKGYVESLFFGLPNGIFNMVVRCAVGAYELVTFPLPFPENYRPMVEPEFLWSEGREENASNEHLF